MRLPVVLAGSLLVTLLAACGPSPGDGDRPPTCGVAPLIFDPRGEVLQASDEDGACVRLERLPIGEPDIMYKEYPYEPVRLSAALEGRFVDVDEPSALRYTPSHHNWLDEMSGEDSEGTSALVVIRYQTSEDRWVLELSMLDEAGATLAGPVSLVPAGQRSDG